MGSLAWFSKIIESGLWYQRILLEHGEICLPMLSDLYPDALFVMLDAFESNFNCYRLNADGSVSLLENARDPQLKITDQLIALATSEAGKEALRKVKNKNTSSQ